MTDTEPGEATLFARIPAELHRELFHVAELANLSVATTVAAVIAQLVGRDHPHARAVTLAGRNYRGQEGRR